MSEEIKKIVANAVVNAELESGKLSQESIDMIESCLKTDNGSFLFQLYLKTRKYDEPSYKVLEGSKNSKYCYDNGVLKNKYGIRDFDLLRIVEGDCAAYYQSQVISGNSDYKFVLDINSYLNLHKVLFSGVYSFAGDIRDEFIYKECDPYLDKKTPFCMPQFIYSSLNDVLFSMKNKIYSINNRDDLVNYLGYFYGELNMVHPFREGNGRTLRTYFLLLVHEINKYISFGNFELNYSLWDEDDKNRLIKGTIINSINGDIDDIVFCFDKVLVGRELKVNKKKMRTKK